MITSFTATPLANNAYRLDWTSDEVAPAFYLYADGDLLITTTATTATVFGVAGIVYEVLDDDTAPASAFPATMLLTWYASANAVEYRIEQYVASVWTEIATIEANDLPYFTFRTGVLADDTTHQFRVVSVSEAGNDGTPATHTALMVRNPDIPNVTTVYESAGGTVTIDEA